MGGEKFRVGSGQFSDGMDPQLLQPGEIIDLKDTIMEAIREGNKTNIELKKTAKKKSAP